MEPIRDLTWMAQKAFGTLEQFQLNGWSVTAVEVAKKAAPGSARSMSKPQGGFVYRLLFFHPPQSAPVYAVDLETSILGDWVISEEEGPSHRVVQRLSGPLGYEDFRIKALEWALQRIAGIADGPSPMKKETERSK
jgi:hypothetical protein